NEGKFLEAEAEYRSALDIKPSAEAHVGLGNALAKQGKKEAAKEEFQKAVAVNPESAQAHRELGTLKYKMNDIVGANTDLNRALVLSSNDTQAGKTLIELWQHQVSHNPKYANAHLGLARAYQVSGNLPSAQNEYRQVVRIDPTNPSLPAARQSFKL